MFALSGYMLVQFYIITFYHNSTPFYQLKRHFDLGLDDPLLSDILRAAQTWHLDVEQDSSHASSPLRFPSYVIFR